MFQTNTFKNVSCPYGANCTLGQICFFSHDPHLLNSNDVSSTRLDYNLILLQQFMNSSNDVSNYINSNMMNNLNNNYTNTTTGSNWTDGGYENILNTIPTSFSNIQSSTNNNNINNTISNQPPIPKPTATKTKAQEPKVTKTKTAPGSKPIVLPPKKQILQDTNQQLQQQQQQQQQQQKVEQTPTTTTTTPQPPPVYPKPIALVSSATAPVQKLKTSIWNPALKNILSKTPNKEITDVINNSSVVYDTNKWLSVGIEPSQIPVIPPDSRTRVPKSVRQTMLNYIIEKCIDIIPKDKAIEEASVIEEAIYQDSQSKNVYLNLISMELPRVLKEVSSKYS